MDRAHMVDEILGMVAQIASIDRAAIRADMPLMGKEIGVDSLALMRLLVRVDERFPGKLQGKDPSSIDFSTVDSLVDSLEK